jgi:hypothetical protein
MNEERRKHRHRFRIMWSGLSQFLLHISERLNMKWLNTFFNNYAATDWDALKLIGELFMLLAICTIFVIGR